MKRTIYQPPVTKYMLKRYEPAVDEENGLWDVSEEMCKEDKAGFRCWCCCVVFFGDNGGNYAFDFWGVCIWHNSFDHGGTC